MATRRQPFRIADHAIPGGRRQVVELPISRLYSGTPVALPIIVLHGKAVGPTVWVSAAVHGDEICGVETIRRVLAEINPRQMNGTIIAVPVVNVHGFNSGDRYLPDRRDLNRSFPGSKRGSLAGRVADLMMSMVVERCSVGIDLHTGSDHRTNYPHIRADLNDEETLALARTFAPPLALHSRTRDGSIRQAATEAGAKVLLFEGGEALRFDPHAIEVSRVGVLRVLHSLQMLEGEAPAGSAETIVSQKSRWLRASTSGILHLDVELGQQVAKGQQLATTYDTFGKRLASTRARNVGVVIAHTQHPLVNRGDAIVHVADLEE